MNSNDQDSHRSDTPLPVPSLKADSINSDSAKSVSLFLYFLKYVTGLKSNLI
jgi:hypothetical protein